MPELSRAQLFVYGAIAIALLALGARWLRSSEGSETEPGAGITAAGGGELEAGGSLEIDQGGAALVVHVAGAVRVPGVYRLPQGSRVADAVERAGGATGAGSADAINLAAKLADGQQVLIPSVVGPGTTPVAGATAAEGPISLGSATLEQLDTIEGIGPVTAEDILEFRDEHGGVGSIDDLDQITGIGPATMEALRDGLQP